MRFAEFGLYEDDYWFIANGFGASGAEIWARLKFYFHFWPSGRPLNHLLPGLLGFAGWSLGGLKATYAIAAVWFLLNVWLVHLIARKVLPEGAALTAGLAYVFFPPDTTRPLLVHAAHVQGAMTFSLLGLLLWRRGGAARAFSYLVAGLALLSYETAFLCFVCAPLILAASAELRNPRTWVRHAAGCIVVVGLVAFARTTIAKWDNNAAVVLSNPMQAAMRSVTSLILGPVTDAVASLYALRQGVRQFDIWAGVAATVLAALLLLWHGWRASAKPETAGSLRSLLWLALRMGIVWSASYALTLTNYPPTQILGRSTSTHMAAALPVALLVGILHAAVARVFMNWKAWPTGIALIGLYLAVSYGQFLQREYARAWRVQCDFWQQVLALCPDADHFSTIIVTGEVSPQRSEVILANSWADYYACQSLFGVDKAGNGPQFAHLGVIGESVKFRRAGDAIEWMPAYWGGPYLGIDPGDLILLHSQGGNLRRVAALETPIGLLTTKRSIPPPGAVRRTYTLFYSLINR